MLKKFFSVFLFLIIGCGFLNISVCKAAKKAKTEPVPAEKIVPEPSLNEMLGSMLMFGFRGETLNTDDGVFKLLSSGIPCNVILFDRDVTTGSDRNIKSPQQLKALNAYLKSIAGMPIFVAVDQEGGQVRRLKPKQGFMDLPSAQSMGQRNVQETLDTADKLAREMTEAGINVDLAPVVDVDTNPFNPAIGKLGRAFNSDAALVAAHALAFGQGLAKNGVIPVLKHFPGQGCASADSHTDMTDVSQCWNADIDLLPYAEIFRAGWPGMVMVGHLKLSELDPDLPASLSANIITGLLREGLGWQGVIISDDLQMKAVTLGRDLKQVIMLALNAGNDILLYGNNLEWNAELPGQVWQALQELIAEGQLTEERVKQSWKRINALKETFGLTKNKGNSEAEQNQ